MTKNKVEIDARIQGLGYLMKERERGTMNSVIGKYESMNSTTTLENSWGVEKVFYNEHLTIAFKISNLDIKQKISYFQLSLFLVEVQISDNRKFVKVDKLTDVSPVAACLHIPPRNVRPLIFYNSLVI